MTDSNKPDALQTKAEAATELEVSTRTVDRYIAKGHLLARKRANGRVLIDSDSVTRFKSGTPALAEGGAAE